MRRLIAICLAGLVLSSVPARAQTVDEVQDKLKATYDKISSYQAKARTVTDMEMAGASIKGETSGLIAWAKKGDKQLSRIEQKGAMTQKMGDSEQKVETSSLTISDGDFFYTLADYAGNKQATKQSVDSHATMDVKALIEDQKQQHNLKLLPEEKLDGVECYVIEATPKDPEGMPYASMTSWFRKSDAIAAKMVNKDKSGKEVYTFHLTDIKVNEDFPPDFFKFTAPEGVEVMDLTKAGGTPVPVQIRQE